MSSDGAGVMAQQGYNTVSFPSMTFGASALIIDNVGGYVRMSCLMPNADFANFGSTNIGMYF